MTDLFYSPPLTPKGGSEDWLQDFSQPESVMDLELSNLDLLNYEGEADAGIFRNRSLDNSIAMTGCQPSSFDNLLLEELLAFQVADTCPPQPYQDSDVWLPVAEELAVGTVTPGPLQYPDPLAWEELLPGTEVRYLSSDSWVPSLGIDETWQQFQPLTNYPAPKNRLCVPLFNVTDTDAYLIPSPSTATHSTGDSSPSPWSSSPPTSPASSSSRSSSSSSSPPPCAARHACASCPASFVKRSELRKHALKHTRPFACPVCARGHAAKRDMHRHVWAHHAADAPRLGVPAQTRRCPVPGCGAEERADNLARHVRTRHHGVKVK